MSDTRPTILLDPAHKKDLAEYFEETMTSLGTYFAVSEAAGDDADMTEARAVAESLEGVVNSSDTDCEYYPCVLRGAEPREDSFFAALGVQKGAVASVSGWENPKLEVVPAGEGEGQRPALALLTRLGEYELEAIDKYLEEGDQAAIGRAIAALEKVGPIVGIQLCTDDGFSKVVLTMARRPSGTHVGVLTIRVET